MPALAGQHQRMNRIVGQHTGKFGNQRIADFVIERVALVGPVDGDTRDPVGAPVDVNDSHFIPSLSR